MEAVYRALIDRNLIEEFHPEIEGSDSCKVSGYIGYWITKLKPVLVIKETPNEAERLVNEFLAVAFAICYIEEANSIEIRTKKFVDHIVYTLRYRTLTTRTLPLIYEAYLTGFINGVNKTTEIYDKALRKN